MSNPVSEPKPLIAEELYHRCDSSLFTFETTAELLATQQGLLGQVRADHSIRFGIAIKKHGYNLFVLGPHGAGKHRFTRAILEQNAKTQSAPHDWIYLNNFIQPNAPLAVSIPAGGAKQLKGDLENLVDAFLDAIPAAFTSEVYQAHASEIETEFTEKREKAMAELRDMARAHHLELVRSPQGLVFLPTKDGNVVDVKAFKKLPADEKAHIEQDMEQMQAKLQAVMQQMPRWQREAREKLRALDTEITLLSVDYLIEELKSKYSDNQSLLPYFDNLKQDVLNNIDVFRGFERENVNSVSKYYGDPFLRRYLANVLVSHSGDNGAPVVYEDNPTHDNLLGRIEHIAQMGTLLTDFMLIKPGALHRANGGYLLLDARNLLNEPMAWEALKRCLSSQCVNIQSLMQSMGLIHTVSLEPDSIPLDLKVILFGNRALYYALCEHDPEFRFLFKVQADFEDSVERNDENNHHFAQLVSEIAAKESLRPFHRDAVARAIEHSSRLAEDSERLEVNLEAIADVLREADHWAQQQSALVVSSSHIQHAIDQQLYRSARVETRLRESILKGVSVIETDGHRIAQVNALTVIDLGHHSFGNPARVTATARVGDGKIVDIEHESELGGDVHTKAVLILSHFISGRYLKNRPFSVSASVAFEQSYSEIDGDSASIAELCAILSAIAELPISQSLAVTGSIDQHGRVQAIGGVNEKVESFFDLCKQRGFNGKQGVIIPASNARHLMLKSELVEAASTKQFQIYAIDTVDEAINLLFGMPAGECDETGLYPEGSVNYCVERALYAMSQVAHESNDHHEEKKD